MSWEQLLPKELLHSRPKKKPRQNRIMLATTVQLLGAASLAAAATPDRFVELWGEESVIDGVDCELDEDVHVCPSRADSTADAAAPIGNECCVPTHLPYGMDPSLATCGGTRPTGLPFAGRSPVYAQHGMAATSVPLSTMCAVDILKAVPPSPRTPARTSSSR